MSQSVRRALYAYNHSWSYVDRVLDMAEAYLRAASSSTSVGPGGPQGGADNITPRMRMARDLIRQRFRVPYGVGCYRAVEDGGDHPRGRGLWFHAVVWRADADGQ